MLRLCLFVLVLATSGLAAKLTPAAEQEAEPRVLYDYITSCPEQYGLQTYPHPDTCHGFFKCANGTLTEELCEHGLLYDGKGGSVYNHCNYHWGVNCEGRYSDVVPHESGPCEYDFGIFALGACETSYLKCEWGQPTENYCTPGLAYSDLSHSCNWPDLLEYCNPEQIVGFACPKELDPKSLSARFLPFPRFPSDDCTSYIVCVNDYPRRAFCGDYTIFDEATLSCQDPKDAICSK